MAETQAIDVRFGAQTDGLIAGCHLVKEAIEGLAAPIQNFMSAIGGIGEAVIAGFAIERIGEWAKEVAASALETTKLAQSVGMSAGELEGFGSLLQGMGGSAESAARENSTSGRSMRF